MNDEHQLLQAIAAAPDMSALEALRVSALGKQGSITAMLKSLGPMDAETRAAEAPAIHALREAVTEAIAARKAALEAAELDRRLATERIDLSLPAEERPQGTIHPVSQVMDELAEIFADLGFAVAEGPEIEDQWHNFTALNMPESHPARAMHDTFYCEPREGEDEPRVLRTHTSPVQIRAMHARGAPLRVIAPGRVYRSDSDATHTPMFHQLEGLVIDRDIHMSHLKWTLDQFIARYFETPSVETRFRPHHFPFTEPSAEMDVRCDRSGGDVKIGQGNDWMEIVGCGMVHPNVLRNCGLDPDQWQGFAFGFGVDRLGMLKYGMPDLRDMFASDVRWLTHYGFSPFQAPNPATGLS